jgi:hypothetical protein
VININSLLECSAYITSINGKALNNNSDDLLKHVLENNVNLTILKKVLKESIESNPEYIQNLYKRLKHKLNNIKHHNDPKVNEMVRFIVEQTTKDTFNNEAKKLLMYLVDIGELKQQRYDKIYGSIINNLKFYII